MPWKGKLPLFYKNTNISWFDLAIIISIFIGGTLYLQNALHWGVAWIGSAQYGDAEFWWNGALHVAQGALKYTNSGEGYRPGYFYLTGLTLPVLGQQFLLFYPYFLFTFLSTTGLFYLALRRSLDRWVAACAVGMLIFNPYTAEWLATSTTDGTGLLLNLLALTCLFNGFNKKLGRKWLMSFGLLFSLATLTRPLLTPFIGVVILLIFSIKQEPFKKRFNIAIFVLAAFCLPTLAWMGVQKATIGQWTVSSKDASVFYAASKPSVQVWNNFMQSDVQKLAAKYYHVGFNDVDDKMLNHVFWQEASKNYIKYPSYHFKRAFLNLLSIARFSPAQATRGNNLWQIVLFEAIIASLLLWLFIQKRYFYGLLFFTMGLLIFLLPKLIFCMVLMGTFLGLMQKDKINRPAMPILSAYWLTGVMALYLVGGTWGELSFSNRFALNALGYRLGSQFFFVSDILAAYFLMRLAQFKFDFSESSVLNRWPTFISRPAPLASGIVMTGYAAFFFAVMMIYLIGGTMVVYRSYALHHPDHIKPYPSLSPIKVAYQHLTGNKLYSASDKYEEITPVASSTPTTPDIIFTGTVSPFIWDLSGQKRAQIMVYAQNNVYPFKVTPSRIILEVPQHLKMADWEGKQGAFIIRYIPDEHNKSNLPYYLTVPALRAFIPLASNKDSFALSKISWFPLVKNATQLETSGELKAQSSKIIWALNSGEEHFKRRFFLKSSPKERLVFNKAKLYLDTSTAHGPTTLSFFYSLGDLPEKQSTKTTQGYYTVTIATVSKSTSSKPKVLKSATNLISHLGKEEPRRKITISIPENTKAVEISFNHIAAGKGVWIYEFNLSVADFHQHAVKVA